MFKYLPAIILSMILGACEKQHHYKASPSGNHAEVVEQPGHGEGKKEPVLAPDKHGTEATKAAAEQAALAAAQEAAAHGGHNAHDGKPAQASKDHEAHKPDAHAPTDLQHAKADPHAPAKADKGAQGGKPAKGDGLGFYKQAQAAHKKKQTEKAKDLYLQACQYGYVKGCHGYAWYQQSLGELRTAARFYKFACKAGVAKSCNNLGWLAESSGHFAEARGHYAQACLTKNPVACQSLKRIQNTAENPGHYTGKLPMLAH